jgi:predicted amidohydrolase
VGRPRQDGAHGAESVAFLLAPDGAVLARTTPARAGIADVAAPTAVSTPHGWPSTASVPVADTPIGRLGLVVGADILAPDPCRALAADGASLVLHLAAPASPGTGGAAGRPAVGAFVTARARENAVVVASAAKAGRESAAVQHLGESAIIAADGAVLGRAPAEGPALVVAEVAAPQASAARRVFRLAATANFGPRERPRLVYVAAGPDRGAWAAAARTLGADLWVAPAPPWERAPEPFIARVADGRAVAVAPGRAVVHVARSWHGPPAVAAPLSVGALGVGVLFGDQLAAPEGVRSVAAAGATAVVAFAERLDWSDALLWARLRAIENRVAVLVSARRQAAVIAPDGAIEAMGEGAAAWLEAPPAP